MKISDEIDGCLVTIVPYQIDKNDNFLYFRNKINYIYNSLSIISNSITEITYIEKEFDAELKIKANSETLTIFTKGRTLEFK